jgi:type II secretory pathway pseudopilin PulG
MKLNCSSQRNIAMTLIEVVVVILVIGFFVAMILPTLNQHSGCSQRISCVNNLKQLGLAYKIWSGDGGDRYPMAVSVTNGGAMEYMDTADAWKTFQVMSNELSTPKIIYCPEDSQRVTATNWGEELKNKISYFIGRDATDASPSAILSGDSNFLFNKSAVKPGLINVTTNDSLTWDATRHGSDIKTSWFTKKRTGSGNLGLADGSVMSATSSDLAKQLQQTGFATNRFAIP